MNTGKEHALEIDLGHDQRGSRIIWDTKDSPTLTVTGHEGCGKTTFADRIMLEAQRDGASDERPCGAYKTISVLLNGIIGQARQTGMAVILTGRGLNRRTMGRYLAARLREEATHVHLGAAPVTPLIRKSNHSHATTMIVNTEADMRTPFGWGAYEDNTGAVRQLRTDIDGKEPGR